MAEENEQLLKREMPKDIEAERALIASMLINRDAFEKASELLVREDFYNRTA